MAYFLIQKAQISYDTVKVNADSYEEALKKYNEEEFEYTGNGDVTGDLFDYGLSFEELPDEISNEFIESYIRTEMNPDRNAEFIQGVLHISKKEDNKQ